MLKRIIEWSVGNKLLVFLFTAAALIGGYFAVKRTPLEALPDLSDVQVIVQAEYNEQAPRIIEDQVTYPIAAEMLKVPGARTVRGYSFFGVSFVYVIFDDGTDLYWARSRVLEYLNGIKGKLPASVAPTLGPDATGLGWVYQYALEDTTGRLNLAQLRSLQDWYLRYALTAVSGVSEVATLGGFEKQYQVDLDPAKLLAYGIPVTRVMSAIQNANADIGAMVMELSEREYMVRGLGYLKSLSDIENVVVGATANGTPIRVAELGRVSVGPAVRRGIAELDGRGDAVGAIVVMRFGQNALTTIDRVKAKLEIVKRGLPPGVVIRPVYDRSELIEHAIETLREKLLEESLIVALVCIAFLLHAESALVAILTLPVGILMAFIAMRWVGVGADIMSLGGIAIAIGAMIDAAIVMIENMHKHLEHAIVAREREREGVDVDLSGRRYFHTSALTTAERWKVVIESSKEVGPALFFSLLIITVSFVPVFALEGQEGRLFKPLAFTKTFAMAAASLLSVTLVPVTMGVFIRGRIWRERANPINRWLIAAYRPIITFVLRNRWPVVGVAVLTLVLTWLPWARLGSEFMPRLDEGTILYMPTTLPGVSVARAREILRTQDAIIKRFPEVASVWGKAGRANTATDPAGLDMFETTIALKPESEWRPGLTYDRLIAELNSAVRLPGVTNAWTMPIRGRIDMLATGIRTPVGIKVFGPDLAELERLGKEIESVVKGVPGTRSVFAERAVSGYYVDIDIDRAAAARYGLNVGDVQSVIATAIGGMTITQTVEGRERYGVRVRYPQELRDSPERLAAVLIPVSTGGGGASGSTMGGGAGGGTLGVTQVPLGQMATIKAVAGPMVVRTEGAQPTAWVYVDVAGRDIGGYVADAQRAVERAVAMPSGYSMQWSGQYEYMERAKQTMRVVIPATLAIIFLLLYFNFKSVGETAIVMLSLPFALVGGLWFVWLLGYNWSVAVAIGFIALAGVAAETGVVMLIYLDHAWKAKEQAAGGATPTVRDLYEAVMDGAVERVRPKMMTVTAIMAGLLPILWTAGTGGSVMKRIAAPMVGGMISSTVLTLVVIPAVYSLWKEREVRRAAAWSPGPAVSSRWAAGPASRPAS
ncbi:MAG: CusA/CzcA family heavy metal efflux RND transporter [Gemmatimonadaceae bacterium]|uniref:efflux RND transporter permease subunit n=1 Tax=Gemmatimonas sp. UBA7669 TaxID=1946568 RepID=UPI0025B90304|nr:CusA/CzcA family heavy metal efflux RND transporter [Gemmatimonas sp. UBA7669]MBX9854837.1 CusA/CzcA family heavy metal efflux RND transporter [Gemmatimonadaceae bacterium]